MLYLANIIAIVLSLLIMAFAIKRFVKVLKNNENVFWKPLLWMVFALTLPPLLLQGFNLIFMVTENVQLTFSVFAIFFIVYITSIVSFLIYAFIPKLNNRKLILCLTSICFVIMNVQGLLYYKSFNLRTYLTVIREYYTATEFIENYKEKNQVFPLSIDEIKYERQYFPDYFYETFNNQKDFVLHVYRGHRAWTLCSLQKLTMQCVPKKWVLSENGQKHFVDIPEKHLKDFLYSANSEGDFAVWFFDIEKFQDFQSEN